MAFQIVLISLLFYSAGFVCSVIASSYELHDIKSHKQCKDSRTAVLVFPKDHCNMPSSLSVFLSV